jgi:hypothetical protein
MSVRQLESEIAKLSPAELKQFTAWFGKFQPLSVSPNVRPRVGEITSAPVSSTEGCFLPLTDDEMTEWGFA